MKRYGSFLILSVMTVLVVAQPRIMVDREVMDMGVLGWKSPARVTFQLKNKGNKPLVISNVESSCGCTQVDWSRKPVGQGEATQIVATYDAAMLGHFKKTLLVHSNTTEGMTLLTLQGEVVAHPERHKISTFPYVMGSLSVDRNTLEFDDVNAGDMPKTILHVKNSGTVPYEPELMHLPTYLSAEAKPTCLGRGETGKIVVTLDSKKLYFMGLNQTNVYLSRYKGDKVCEDNEIQVSAVLLPDFSMMSVGERAMAPGLKISEEHPVMELGGKKKRSTDVVLSNTGKSILEIRSVQLFNKAIGVSLGKRSLNPGESTKLTITAYRKYLKKAKGQPRVLIISNDPERPKRIISVEVRD